MVITNAFRDGIFSLRTRRFWDVAEIMIKKKFNLEWSNKNSHDLIDSKNNDKVEVKFSTALKSHKETINEENVITEILEARNEERMFKQKDWKEYEFDCNIQQVKKKEFDWLYYGIFFSDKVEIFYIKKHNINGSISYSNKQHRWNIWEWQFHVNKTTYENHKENFFIESITYEELLTLLK